MIRPRTYLERKMAGVCVRCGVKPASDTSVLCDVHQEYAAKKVKEHHARKRLGMDRTSLRILRRTATRQLLLTLNRR